MLTAEAKHRYTETIAEAPVSGPTSSEFRVRFRNRIAPRLPVRLASALLLVSLSVASAFAQKISGDIEGTVTDRSGAVVPKAEVAARSLATGALRLMTTNASGTYRLAELPIGFYEVSASADGFKTTVRQVEVATSTVSHADFVLALGAKAESVVVSATTPLVEVSEDRLHTFVDQHRVTNLPISGRDINSLLGIVPGVQRVPGGGFLTININGVRRSANNFLVDGISNNDRFYGDSVLNQTGVVGIPATLIPIDATQEFVVEELPSAEFGVKGGAVINVVMKSGGNDLHGSAYYLGHSDSTDARNFFSANRPPFRNQQFGGVAGGPIVKDRTFFFVSYEAQRLSAEAPYVAVAPTESEVLAARARIAGLGLSTNPAGENLLKFFPINPDAQGNRLAVTAPTTDSMNGFSLKVDHKVNQNHSISGRYFFGDSLQSAPAQTGELTPPAPYGPDLFNSVAPTRAQLGGLSWTWIISSSKLLESRIGLSRFSQALEINNHINPLDLGIDTGALDPADYGVPVVNVSDFGSIGGVAGYPLATQPNQSLDWSEHFTDTRGKHTLKLGGNWQRAYTNGLRNRARTTFDVLAPNHVDALTSLLLGRFDDASRSFGDTRRLISEGSAGFYVEDDWKVRPRLTLNVGLRYDLNGAIGEERDRGSNFFPGRGLVDIGHGLSRLYNLDQDAFGPRLGFAWDVFGDGKTAVRGGYALAYDVPTFGTLAAPRVSFVGGANAAAFTQIDQGVFSVSLDQLSVAPVVPIFGPNPTPNPPYNAFAIAPNFETPLIHYFNLSLERQLAANTALTVSYVGSRGGDLFIYRDLNAPPVGTSLNNIQASRPFDSAFPDLKHIIQLTNLGKSWYDSLQASVRQRNWHGLDVQYNFTWSKSLDYSSVNRGSQSSFPQLDNPLDIANNKGPSDFDVPFNFNVGGTYKVPRAQKLRRLGDGWELAGVYTALGGRPFTPMIGSLDPSGQDIRAIRANWNGQPVEYHARNPQHYVANPQVFSVPPNGTIGTAGRNILRGPGLSQLDLSLIKNTKINERFSLQFRLETFNLLNRANFGDPGNNVRLATFGTITSTPEVQSAKEGGGAVVGGSSARTMQGVLKLVF